TTRTVTTRAPTPMRRRNATTLITVLQPSRGRWCSRRSAFRLEPTSGGATGPSPYARAIRYLILSMLKRLIFDSSVDGGTSSRAAAEVATGRAKDQGRTDRILWSSHLG